MEKDVNNKILEEIKKVLQNEKSSPKEDLEAIKKIFEKYNGR